MESKMNSRVMAKALPEATRLEINPKEYYKQKICGYYNFNCVVTEEVTRSAKFYIPEGSIYNQPTIFVMVPEKTDSYDFLVESGWKSLADEEKLYIVLMEPDKGDVWQDMQTECTYISALNEDVSLRPFFCAFSASFYAVAYGKQTNILGIHSRRNPKQWAAVALLGTTGMTKEELADLEISNSRVEGVALSQVQMPVWIVTNEESIDITQLVEYYINSNHCSKKEINVENELVYYAPEEIGGIDEHWCAKVYYDKKDWTSYLSKDAGKLIYHELFQGVYRYPGYGNGALRSNKDIYTRGFQKFSELVSGGFKEDGSDLYQRDWWVYVPDKVDTTRKNPAVFVFHGAGGSGDEIADRSGWAYVAEKYGFILICPSASIPNVVRKVSDMETNEMFRAMWNTGNPGEKRPADFIFLDYLYKWLTSHYNIDTSRVYASGQSSGGMMSWSCAAYRPDYFAAVAPISARVFNIEAEPNDPVEGSIVPIMSNLGTKDGAFPGTYSTEEGKKMINYWSNRYHLIEKWDNYTYMDGGRNCSFKEDNIVHYVFKTQTGIPLLHCMEIIGKTHAIMPSECEYVWNEWFTKFSKDVTSGKLYYEGNEVKIEQ